MSAQFVTNDGMTRIVVEDGRIYIRVLNETTDPGCREALERLKVFIKELESDGVHISEVMNRKIQGVTGQYEPDCVVLRLV